MMIRLPHAKQEQFSQVSEAKTMEGLLIFAISSLISREYIGKATSYSKIITSLEEEVVKLRKLREDERQGRITVQKEHRKQVTQQNLEQGYQFSPIGYIESPYPERRGTPRQPLLVPASRGRIRFNKQKIQYQHYEELAQFSHIWVIFIFHENTNQDKDQNHQNSPVLAKIKPPRLHGVKVGCLSTRSPHRPNAIGLSVCEVIGINKAGNYLEISGIDMLHNTPVLDIKPYIPYDIIPSSYALPMAYKVQDQQQPRTLTVPNWIVDSDIPLLPVSFTLQAEQGIEEIYSNDHKKTRQFERCCEHADQVKELIRQILRQDIRSHHQGRGKQDNKNNKKKDSNNDTQAADDSNGNSDSNNQNLVSLADEPQQQQQQQEYSCHIDLMDILFEHQEHQIEVKQVTALYL